MGLTVSTFISCVDLSKVDWQVEVDKAAERAKMGVEEADIALRIATEDASDGGGGGGGGRGGVTLHGGERGGGKDAAHSATEPTPAADVV